MTDSEASLDLRLRKTLGAFTLDVTVATPLGGTIGVMGPSGSGKSTLLACIAGHLRPDAGHIAVGDRVLFDAERSIDVPPAKREVGLVFQDALLFPHMSVRANLLYGAGWGSGWGAGFGVGRDEVELLAHIVAVLDLGSLLTRRPGALSGGERQRVALGRALMARPRLLLLDEPLASLDGARRDAALQLLVDVSRGTGVAGRGLAAKGLAGRGAEGHGMAMVYVSHAPEEIAWLTDRVVHLGGHSVYATAPAAGAGLTEATTFAGSPAVCSPAA